MRKWEAIIKVNLSTLTTVIVEANTEAEAMLKAAAARPHGEADCVLDGQEVVSVREITP